MNHIKIPKLKLDMEKLGCVAETEGIYTVESNHRGVIYACAGNEIAIITHSHGYLRLKADKIPIMIEELQGILGDVEYLKSVGARS